MSQCLSIALPKTSMRYTSLGDEEEDDVVTYVPAVMAEDTPEKTSTQDVERV